jgi:hypothetical protein
VRRSTFAATLGVFAASSLSAALGCGNAAAPGADAGGVVAEICTDGVDNDGNGLVDCEDPACQAGYTCVAAPAGWSFGAFASIAPGGQARPCPPGYATSPTFVQEPASSVTCTCTCPSTCGEVFCGGSPNAPPGPVVVSGASADGGCAAPVGGVVPSSGCSALQLSKGQAIGFAAPPFESSGTLSEGLATVGHPEDVLCFAPTGGGCGAGQACVPRPSSTWKLCGVQAAAVDDGPLTADGVCPHDLVASLPGEAAEIGDAGDAGDAGAPLVFAVATRWDESSACNECDCESDPEAGCADAVLTLYADSSCQSPVSKVGPGVCAPVAQDIRSASYGATAVHIGCTDDSHPAPTGVETPYPDAGFVVCCGHG